VDIVIGLAVLADARAEWRTGDRSYFSETSMAEF
jgi:hypothetical protein